jgi:hypothetical protein
MGKYFDEYFQSTSARQAYGMIRDKFPKAKLEQPFDISQPDTVKDSWDQLASKLIQSASSEDSAFYKPMFNKVSDLLGKLCTDANPEDCTAALSYCLGSIANRMRGTGKNAGKASDADISAYESFASASLLAGAAVIESKKRGKGTDLDTMYCTLYAMDAPTRLFSLVDDVPPDLQIRSKDTVPDYFLDAGRNVRGVTPPSTPASYFENFELAFGDFAAAKTSVELYSASQKMSEMFDALQNEIRVPLVNDDKVEANKLIQVGKIVVECSRPVLGLGAPGGKGSIEDLDKPTFDLAIKQLGSDCDSVFDNWKDDKDRDNDHDGESPRGEGCFWDKGDRRCH